MHKGVLNASEMFQKDYNRGLFDEAMNNMHPVEIRFVHKKNLDNKKLLGIGETGLDFYYIIFPKRGGSLKHKLTFRKVAAP